MKNVLGILFMICGVALGLYAGLWWAFIGGIMDIVAAVQLQDVPPMEVAIGIAKIVFAGAIGAFSAFVLMLPGAALLGLGTK